MRNIQCINNTIRMVEARHGLMIYNQYDSFIGKALELYGEYCEHEVEIFRHLLQPTDVVWEIGANTGSQAPALAKLVSQGHYVGFEPQIELFKLLVTNLTLNGCNNSQALMFALGEKDGVIELPAINYDAPQNFGGISLLGRNQNPKRLKVEIRQIDSLWHLPSPNFLKIDVEGMESMVLRGGEKTIHKHRPLIYIENDRIDLDGDGNRSAELIQLLWDFDYQLYWHISTYYNPQNYYHNTTNLYGNTSSFNMLGIHNSHKLEIKGLPKVTDKYYHPLKQSK